MPGESASQPRSVSRRASSKPVVPTTAWMPWLDAELEVVHDHVGMGEVDDGLGAGGDQVLDRVAGVDRGRPARGPSAASTARHTSEPTLPRAPSTPTLPRRLALAAQPRAVSRHGECR